MVEVESRFELIKVHLSCSPIDDVQTERRGVFTCEQCDVGEVYILENHLAVVHQRDQRLAVALEGGGGFEDLFFRLEMDVPCLNHLILLM